MYSTKQVATLQRYKIIIKDALPILAKDLSLFPNRKKMPSETDGIYNLLACAC